MSKIPEPQVLDAMKWTIKTLASQDVWMLLRRKWEDPKDLKSMGLIRGVRVSAPEFPNATEAFEIMWRMACGYRSCWGMTESRLITANKPSKDWSWRFQALVRSGRARRA